MRSLVLKFPCLFQQSGNKWYAFGLKCGLVISGQDKSILPIFKFDNFQTLMLARETKEAFCLKMIR